MIDEDRVLSLAKALAPSGGVYVEAGANDGLRQSNSLALERELGWSGVLVEPSPAAFRELVTNRPGNHCVNAALVATAAPGTTAMGAFRDGHLTGTMVPSLFERAVDEPHSKYESAVLRARRALRRKPPTTLITVPAITLDAALTECGIDHVDVLSLDVEGYEVSALRGLDFARVRPSLIILEVRPSDVWDLLQILLTNGYAAVENLSSFVTSGSATWTGDHEDYLFVDTTVLYANPALVDALRGES